MNYKKHYDTLVERCSNRSSEDLCIEKHHVVPKCMGGTDDTDNIVKMTPEEHFVAHQLLCKMYPENRKLIFALSKMCSASSKNTRTNKRYGWLRRKFSENVAGENNTSAKFTNKQVLDIYHSTENMDILADRYGVSRYNIITIKRRMYYKSVTRDIVELPGYCETDRGRGKNIPIPMDLIEKIYYDTGDYDYFWNTYRATPTVVRSIKTRKVNKSITKNLKDPGQIKRYGLTYDEVVEIFESEKKSKELAAQYNISAGTVSNIKNSKSRAYSIWNDF